MKKFADIAVALPVESTFTYAVPEELRLDARLGKRVLVPFGNRTVTGYILGLSSAPPPDIAKIKPIIDRVFPFEETKEALDYFGSGKVKGKVVIKM